MLLIIYYRSLATNKELQVVSMNI